jgi:hypothetical protein
MPNPPPGIAKEIASAETAKAALELVLSLLKLGADIEEHPARKLRSILDKLTKHKDKLTEEEFKFALEQAIKAQKCEFFVSKRILKIYEKEVRIITHFV